MIAIGLGHNELLVIFFIVLLLFGAKKIPEVFRALGSGIKEFKKAASDIEKEIEAAGKEDSSGPTG